MAGRQSGKLVSHDGYKAFVTCQSVAELIQRRTRYALLPRHRLRRRCVVPKRRAPARSPASERPAWCLPWLRNNFQRSGPTWRSDPRPLAEAAAAWNCVNSHPDHRAHESPEFGRPCRVAVTSTRPMGACSAAWSDHRRQRLAEPMRIGPHRRSCRTANSNRVRPKAGRRGFLQRRPHFLLHIQQGTRVDTAR